jgi:signal transduction histidine kinase
MAGVRWRSGGLFWRLFVSYFAATLAAALIATYVGRFEGPFGFLRDSDLVSWFNHIGNNSANSGVLFVALATTIGTVTGLLVSRNLARRLRGMTRAAESWSQGDFSARVPDPSRDELGQVARDLNHMADQIQALLAARQELAVVEERNRLARELHDSVKQQVFANALLVRAARKQLDRAPETAKTHLEEAEELATRTQQELIELIRALRPAAISDRGLVAVMRAYADDWSRQMGIGVDVRVQGARATPLDVEEALFRIAQEALANVAKHSEARRVELRLAWEDDQVSLSIRDDGNGFDVSRAAGKGLGLASMRERAEQPGGALAIASAPDGTCVEARVPMHAPGPDSLPGIHEGPGAVAERLARQHLPSSRWAGIDGEDLPSPHDDGGGA